MATCKVCEVKVNVAKAQDETVCGACKRFFSRQKLVHATLEHGSSTCRKKIVSSILLLPAQFSKAGTFWRNVCPKCRFDRCIEAGMTFRGSTKAVESNLEAQLPITPSSNEASKMENNMLALAASSQSFLSNYKAHLTQQQNVPFSSDDHVTFWRETSVHYETLACHQGQLLRALPGFTDLDLSDRMRLFSFSLTKLNLAASCLTSPKDTCPTPLSMPAQKIVHFLEKIPELQFASSEIIDIGNIFQAWKPSPTEQAFLCGFLFLLKANRENLINRELIDRSVEYLMAMYHHIIGDDKERQAWMMTALGALEDSNLRCFEAVLPILTRCPELLQSNSLVSEAFHAICSLLDPPNQ